MSISIYLHHISGHRPNCICQPLKKIYTTKLKLLFLLRSFLKKGKRYVEGASPAPLSFSSFFCLVLARWLGCLRTFSFVFFFKGALELFRSFCEASTETQATKVGAVHVVPRRACNVKPVTHQPHHWFHRPLVGGDRYRAQGRVIID